MFNTLFNDTVHNVNRSYYELHTINEAKASDSYYEFHRFITTTMIIIG